MAGPSGSNSGSSQQQRDSKQLLDHASRAAEQFVSLYYSASDSPSRSSLLPTLYLPTSTIVWNGNPIQGQGGLKELIDRMPFSHYDVQAADCHPIGGNLDAATTQAPSLMLTVSGIVTHHTSKSYTTLPPDSAPNSKRKSTTIGSDPSLPLDSLPRSFSQNFVLVDQKAETQEGGIVIASEDQSSNNKNGKEQQQQQGITGRYFVLADNFRFVG
ncbi:unnamed protein product [Sympodiomycopsis kandeliae]